jgi:hypothetical protein
VTGNSKSATGYDFATIKYLSVDGSQQGVARYNSVGQVNDSAKGIVVDSQYNVYVAGQGFSPLDYVLVKIQPVLNPPIVSAPSATQVTTNAALFSANVNPQGAPTTCYFQYGITTNYGFFSATNAIGSGNNIVAVAASITGLAPGTLYHCRVIAFNTVGTTLGEDSTFTTSFGDASIITLSPFSGAGATPNPFRVQVSAPVGSTYVILASTNNQVWVPIATNVALSANFILEDAAATNYPMRFYRAVLLSFPQ